MPSKKTGSEDEADEELRKKGLSASRIGKPPEIVDEEIFGTSSTYDNGKKVQRADNDSVLPNGSVLALMTSRIAKNFNNRKKKGNSDETVVRIK